MAAAEYQTWLGPDDLRAQGEAAGEQALGDQGGVDASMPDIGNLTGERRPGFPPVGSVIVLDLAQPLGGGHPARSRHSGS